MTARKEAQARFAKKDVAEVATGACIMAFPGYGDRGGLEPRR